MYASQKSGLDPIDWKSSFLSILYERVSLAYQLAGASCMWGFEDGTEDDGAEGGRSLMGALGQIWVNPAFTEITAYYSLAQYRDSDLIQCG